MDGVTLNRLLVTMKDCMSFLGSIAIHLGPQIARAMERGSKSHHFSIGLTYLISIGWNGELHVEGIETEDRYRPVVASGVHNKCLP
jgi:hypothetical protein